MATIYLIAPLPMINCDTGDIYVGSTRQKLAQRWSKHKTDYKRWLDGRHNNCSSFRLFEKYGVENCTIIEIERCDVENRYEREAYWIGWYDSVNQRNSTHDRKEYSKKYQEENRERIAEYARQHYQQNKEQIAEQKRQYYQQNKERIVEYMRQYQQRKKAENATKSGCIDG